jgi:outer membrane protein assembly factor BamE (lipoprotein component of BamABCDE complex)
MKQKNIFYTSLIAISLFSAGCAERVTTHGQVIKTQNVQQIVTGQHRKEDVQYLLGSPSATATFNTNTWYYLSEKKVSKPLANDKITERRVITVTFDDKGLVKNIDDITMADIPETSLNERITPTHGQSLGVLDQMIENIGPSSF